jgi:hypothetical protein
VNANPLYSFLSARAGDLGIGPVLISLLNTKNDPRRAAIGDKLKATDTIKSSTGFGSFYTSANSPIVLCSYTELKFIESEANLRLGKNTEAKAAYVDAVKASLSSYGVSQADADAYVAQASVVPSGNITLQDIMEQKYIALYTQFESYTDWRRTNFPTLTPVKGSAIPRRFPTPQNQRLFNGANVPAGGTETTTWIYKPVWWDA